MGKATLALSGYVVEKSNWSLWSPWGHKEGICDYNIPPLCVHSMP